jgi:hypothetical protein
MVFDEDGSCVRAGYVVEILAIIRSFILNLKTCAPASKTNASRPHTTNSSSPGRNRPFLMPAS